MELLLETVPCSASSSLMRQRIYLQPNWGVAALGLTGISRELSLGFMGMVSCGGKAALGGREYRVVYLWDMRGLVCRVGY
jgi:hypothetical protein